MKIWPLIITLCIILLFATLLFNNHPLEKIRMYVKVDNYTGFKVDTDAVYFGAIPPNSQSTRIINITNNDAESLVTLKAVGEIKKWISFSENIFLLKENETRLIKITISIPEDAKYKEYSGTLNIFFG